MLSILIPIYNFDIRVLVKELHVQAMSLSLPVEILCFDDCSEEHWRMLNREVQPLSCVVYREMPKNHGRSQIRNLLADAAQGSHLLFLDCDSAVSDKAYLQHYVEALDSKSVLYGGRSYQDKPPADAALFLHWHYGSHREQMTPTLRRKTPYHHFMTNNFLIPTAVFQTIRFDERLRQYGHEDTLFGMRLREDGVPIRHLDNPLIHIGLEPARVFLDKTREGIQNLAFLYHSRTGIETRLTLFYEKLNRTGLTTLVKATLASVRPLLVRNLLSAYPSLFLFDLYKLSLLLKEL